LERREKVEGSRKRVKVKGRRGVGMPKRVRRSVLSRRKRESLNEGNVSTREKMKEERKKRKET
jgi:hypothetical protein